MSASRTSAAPPRETSIVNLLLELLQCSAAVHNSRGAVAATAPTSTASTANAGTPLVQTSSFTLPSLHGSWNPPSSLPPTDTHRDVLTRSSSTAAGPESAHGSHADDHNSHGRRSGEKGEEDERVVTSVQRIHALCEQIVEQLFAREHCWARAVVCVDMAPAAIAESPYIMDGEEEEADAIRLRTWQREQSLQQDSYQGKSTLHTQGVSDGSCLAPNRVLGNHHGHPHHSIRPLTASEQQSAASAWPCVLVRDAYLQRCLARAVEILERNRAPFRHAGSGQAHKGSSHAHEDDAHGVGEGVGGSVQGAPAAPLQKSQPWPAREEATRAGSQGSGEDVADVYAPTRIAVSTASTRTRVLWTPTSVRSPTPLSSEAKRDGHVRSDEAATATTTAATRTGLTASPSLLTRAYAAHAGAAVIHQLEAAVTTSTRLLRTTSPAVQHALAAEVSQQREQSAESSNASESVSGGGDHTPAPLGWHHCHVTVPSLLHTMLGTRSDETHEEQNSGTKDGVELTDRLEAALTRPTMAALHAYRRCGSRGRAEPSDEANVSLHDALCALLRLPSPSDVSTVSGEEGTTAGRTRATQHASEPSPDASGGHLISSALPLVVGLVCRREPCADVEDAATTASGEGAVAAGLLSSWGVDALDASGLRIRLLPATYITGVETVFVPHHEEKGNEKGATAEANNVSTDDWASTGGASALSDFTSMSSLDAAANGRPAAASPNAVPPVRFSACVLELSGTVRDHEAARAVWLLLVSIVHFVHAVGPRAFVEEVAKYVAEAVRERRRTRASSIRVHPLKAALEGSLADVSAPITVLAFFFTLQQERCDGETSGEAREDAHGHATQPPMVVEADAQRSGSQRHACDPSVELFPRTPAEDETESISTHASSPGSSPRLMPPPQLTPLRSASRRRRAHDDRRDDVQSAVTGDAATECSVAEWMYQTLIPTFYEITYENAAEAPEEGNTISDADGDGSGRVSTQKSGRVSSSTSPAAKKSRARRRQPKRKKKTSLLARVQLLSDVHPDLLRTVMGELPPVRDNSTHESDVDGGTASVQGHAESERADARARPMRADEDVLLRFILSRQLFFRDVVQLAMSHHTPQTDGLSSLPPSHAPLPVPVPAAARATAARAPSVAAETTHVSPLRSASFHEAPTTPVSGGGNVAAAGSASGTGKRRVSFNSTLILHHPSSPTRDRLDRSSASLLPSYASLSGTSSPHPLSSPRAASPPGMTPTTGTHRLADVSVLSVSPTHTEVPSPSAVSPVRSILKSGHRYRVSKLIRHSAPPSSVVPFHNAILWRCLVAEQLAAVSTRSAAVDMSAQCAPSTLALGDVSDKTWQNFFHLTSTMYVSHVRDFVTRATDEVGSLLLLGAIREALDDGGPTTNLQSSATSSPGRTARGAVKADDVVIAVERGAFSTRVVDKDGLREGKKLDEEMAAEKTVVVVRDVNRRVLFAHLARVAEVLTNAVNAPFWYAQINPSGPPQSAPSRLVDAARLVSGRAGGARAASVSPLASPPGRATSSCSVLAPILPLSVGGRFRLYCEVASRTCVFGALLSVYPAMDNNMRRLTHAMLTDKTRVLIRPLVHYVTTHLLGTHTACDAAEAPASQSVSTHAYTQAHTRTLRLIMQLGSHVMGTVLLPHTDTATAVVGVSPTDADRSDEGPGGSSSRGSVGAPVGLALARSWSYQAQRPVSPDTRTHAQAEQGDRFTDILSNALWPEAWVVPGEASVRDLESDLLPFSNGVQGHGSAGGGDRVDDEMWQRGMEGTMDEAVSSRCVFDGDPRPQTARWRPARRPGAEEKRSPPLDVVSVPSQLSSFAQWLPVFMNGVPLSSFPRQAEGGARDGSADMDGDAPSARQHIADDRSVLNFSQLEPMSDQDDVHYLVGVRENALLDPWLAETKNAVLAAFLSNWFLPLWAAWSARWQPTQKSADTAATVEGQPASAAREGLSADVLRATLGTLVTAATQLETALADLSQALARSQSPIPPPTATPLPRTISPSASPPRLPLARTTPPHAHPHLVPFSMMGGVGVGVGSGQSPLSSLPDAPLTPPRVDAVSGEGATTEALAPTTRTATGAVPAGNANKWITSVPLEAPITAPAMSRSPPTSALPLTPTPIRVPSPGSADAVLLSLRDVSEQHETATRRRVSFNDGPPPGTRSSAETDVAGGCGGGSSSSTSAEVSALRVKDGSHGIANLPAYLSRSPTLTPVAQPQPPPQTARALHQSAQASHAQAAVLTQAIAQLLRQLPEVTHTGQRQQEDGKEAGGPHPQDHELPSATSKEVSAALSMGFQGSQCSSPSEEELSKRALSRVASQRYAPLHLAAPQFSASHASAMAASVWRADNSSVFGQPMMSLGNSELISVPTAGADGYVGRPSDSVLTMVSRPNVLMSVERLVRQNPLSPEQQTLMMGTELVRADENESEGAGEPTGTHCTRPNSAARAESELCPGAAVPLTIIARDASTQTARSDSTGGDDVDDDSRTTSRERRDATLANVTPSCTGSHGTPQGSSGSPSQSLWRSPSTAPALGPSEACHPHIGAGPGLWAAPVKRSPPGAMNLAAQDAPWNRPRVSATASPTSSPLWSDPSSARWLPPCERSLPSADAPLTSRSSSSASLVSTATGGSVPRCLLLTSRPPSRDGQRQAPDQQPVAEPAIAAPLPSLSSPHTPLRVTATTIGEPADGEDRRSFPLTPSPTPKSLAAVTALADLQQQLSASKDAVEALTHRARCAEDALAEREVYVKALEQKLAEKEADMPPAFEQAPTAGVPTVSPAFDTPHTVVDADSTPPRQRLSALQHNADVKETAQTPTGAGGHRGGGSGGEDRSRVEPRALLLAPPTPSPPPQAVASSATPLNSLELWHQRRNQQQPQQALPSAREEVSASSREASPDARKASASPGSGLPSEARAGQALPPPPLRRTAQTQTHTNDQMALLQSVETQTVPSSEACVPPPAPKIALIMRSTQTSPCTPPAAPPAPSSASELSLPRASPASPRSPPASAADVRAEHWQQLLDSEREKHAIEKDQLEHRLRELSHARAQEPSVEARDPEDALKAMRLAHEEEVAALRKALARARDQLADAQNGEGRHRASVTELARALKEADRKYEALQAALRARESSVQDAEEEKQVVAVQLDKMTAEAACRRAQRDRAEKAKRDADDLVWAQARALRHVLHHERTVLLSWMYAQLDLFVHAAASVAEAAEGRRKEKGGSEATRRGHRRAGTRGKPMQKGVLFAIHEADTAALSRSASLASVSSSDTSSPTSTASYASHARDSLDKDKPGVPHRQTRRASRSSTRGTAPSSSPPPLSAEHALVAAEAAMRMASAHEDPLGLQFELERHRRRAAALEETLAQHEAAHETDKRTIHTLRHLLEVQRELGACSGESDEFGGRVAAPTRAPQLPWALKASFMPSQTAPASSAAASATRELSEDPPRQRCLSTVRPLVQRGGSVVSLSSVPRAASSVPAETRVPDAALSSPLPRRSGAVREAAQPPVQEQNTSSVERGGRIANESGREPTVSGSVARLSAVENSRAGPSTSQPADSRSRSRAAPSSTSQATLTPANVYRQRYASLKAYL